MNFTVMEIEFKNFVLLISGN